MSRFAFALLSVLLLWSRYFAQDPAVVYGVATPTGGGVTSVLRMATYAGAGAPLTTVDLNSAIQGEFVEIHQNNNTPVAEILALVDDAAGGTERIVSYSNPFNNRSTLTPFPWSESQILSRQTLQSQALLTGQGISLVRITDFAVDDSPAGAGTLIVVGTDPAQDTVVVRVTAAGVAVAVTTIGTNFMGLGGSVLRPLVAVDPAGLAAPSSAAGNCQIVISEFLPSGASSPIVPYHASLTSAFAVATGLTSVGSGFLTNITQVADIAFNSIAGNAFPVLMICNDGNQAYRRLNPLSPLNCGLAGAATGAPVSLSVDRQASGIGLVLTPGGTWSCDMISIVPGAPSALSAPAVPAGSEVTTADWISRGTWDFYIQAAGGPFPGAPSLSARPLLGTTGISPQNSFTVTAPTPPPTQQVLGVAFSDSLLPIALADGLWVNPGGLFLSLGGPGPWTLTPPAGSNGISFYCQYLVLDTATATFLWSDVTTFTIGFERPTGSE